MGDLWNPAEEFGHLSAAKDQNPSAVHVVEVRKVHGEKYQKSPKKWEENNEEKHQTNKVRCRGIKINSCL